MNQKKVIIIGAGFGGIKAAKALRKANVELLIIDKTNHHLFQPLLYQVATAALSAKDIATPIREILLSQKSASVIMDEVVGIDKHSRYVHLLSGEILSYDYLVVAAGASFTYFGHDEWKPFAPGLKTLSDAVKIREQILWSFELAERCESPEEAKKHLRFVVIGGGPTGVEMAGAIAEIALKSMKNFRKINPKESEIFLIEGLGHILPSYPLSLRIRAEKDLEKIGVKVLTNTKVTDINPIGVFFGDQLIETHNVFWAAGNQASALLKTLEVPLDRQGRVLVEQDLTVSGYPELFVIGDAAAFIPPGQAALPGVAPVAMQQGRYVAKIIAQDVLKDKRRPFVYFDKGSMATIGKAKAVATVGRLSFSGLPAWLIWSFIHIAYLISFRNRFIVMSQWIFLYMTNKRNACLTHSVDEIKEEKEMASS